MANRSQTFVVRDMKTRQSLASFVKNLSLGKPWEITIKRHVKHRSLSQNALYHKWCSLIADHTGHSHDDVCEAMKQEFLAPVIINITGKHREVWTTTDLSTTEMKDYMDRIYAFATSELGMIGLPLPEEMGMK